jgi:hypothetical protein
LLAAIDRYYKDGQPHLLIAHSTSTYLPLGRIKSTDDQDLGNTLSGCADQAASVERVGFERLIRNIRDIEKSLGDGVKRLYDSELGPRKKLRRVR